ncbi:hypothetical protein RRG08_028626 [Elysia crispata]|uniref:G-protein coupled receptors family 1 profile domain-containing protein n=1 Tax=Elysia crispata TaxID=231223 RepID=A0AAE0ZRU9_9GAST|nr:hypothetical protein RRG08_028626 [Elysia crispata]
MGVRFQFFPMTVLEPFIIPHLDLCVVIPIACVSVCNTILVCCLRRRRSLFAQHVQLRQHSDVRSPATQLSSATAANVTPSHSRENSYEKRRGCPRDDALKLSPIYRRDDGHSCGDECFDCGSSRCKHSPASVGGTFGRSQNQSSSFIRLGGRQYHGSSLSNCSTPLHQHNQHNPFNQQQQQQQQRKKKSKNRAPGGHSGDAKVTSMVLAVTWTFLISQAFAGAQIIVHLTGSQGNCGQRCVLFNQFCDLVFALVSATNFLLYYAFGQRFRRIIRKRFCWRRSSSNCGTGHNLADSMGSRSTRQSVR